MFTQTRRRSGERGQAIVLMVGGMLAIIGLIALVIDGGNWWAQQRSTQNAADAAAEAGAVVLADKLAGASQPASGWDAEVNSKVQAMAAQYGIPMTAYYTDICGIPLTPGGTAALNADGTYNLAAADQVGSGALPGGSATTPDCPSLTVGPPAGVIVVANKSVNTYFARVVGMDTVQITTNGTAVSGWRQDVCDATQGQACALLPITIPVSPIMCGNNGQWSYTGGDYIAGVTYEIPLCKNTAGNVGWLDWTPPGGGTSEIVQEILTPNNPPINLPSWQYVSQAGNPNSQSIEDAINTYSGQVVLLPMFDVTCATTPTFSQVAVPPSYGCSSLGGNGQNNWYRFPAFAAFQLCSASNPACTVNGVTYTQGAYTNGSNGTFCGVNWSGAGCLVGQFVNIIQTGTVGATGGGGTSPTKVVGVQLIK